jgi:hypothetical protein
MGAGPDTGIELKGNPLFHFGQTQEKPKGHARKPCHFLASRCVIEAGIAFFHARFTPCATVLSRGGLNLRHVL